MRSVTKSRTLAIKASMVTLSRLGVGKGRMRLTRKGVRRTVRTNSTRLSAFQNQGRSAVGLFDADAHQLKALISTTKRTERVFLIGLELKSGSSWQTRDSLDELAELAATAGGAVVGDGTQKLEAPVAGTFIGTGKAAEFAEFCRQRCGYGRFRRRAFARAKPQPGKGLRLQGAGPDGA
jgi:hypothetical protein